MHNNLLHYSVTFKMEKMSRHKILSNVICSKEVTATTRVRFLARDFQREGNLTKSQTLVQQLLRKITEEEDIIQVTVIPSAVTATPLGKCFIMLPN